MEPARAIAELLGAINYLASAVLLTEEQMTVKEHIAFETDLYNQTH